MPILRWLCRWLFGWKYVYFEYGYDSRIRLVRKCASGEYVVCCGQIIFLSDGGYCFKPF